MGASIRPVPDPGDRASGEVIALGSELETLFDRLARRQGNVTLAQFRVLDALEAADPEPLEPLELARMLHLGSNHITMLLDSLEDRALLERSPHPHDRRRRLVRATPQGLEGVRVLAAHMAALEDRILGEALDPAERAHLRTLASRVRRVIAGVVIPDTRARPGP